MTDNLRDRIAKIAKAHIYNEWAVLDPEVCSCGESETYVWPQHFATVLIRELEMQVGASALFLVDDKKVIHNRYTTKWVADE